MSWTTTNVGEWRLICEDPNVSEPSKEIQEVWGDSYLKIFLDVDPPTVTYYLSVDKRRTYDILENPEWLMLVFGKNRTIRHGLKGLRLFMDKHVLIERYGLRPRMYFVVARETFRLGYRKNIPQNSNKG